MATGKDRAIGWGLRTLFHLGATAELTDGQLLERFATGRGEASELAFGALVERHGPMVYRVCRGVLRDPDDSKDAAQATFLVLVAKARGLCVRDSIGPWLHQVAYRTACCARSNAARRRRLESRAAVVEATLAEPIDDLARVLHEEIGRLPERFRAPVVLCDLEGRTHEQAARALGWPVGTVKSRQARAREKLRDRLQRRGVAPGLALFGGLPGLDAEFPTSLVNSTAAAAARFVATRAIVPGTAAALAKEVIQSMIILKWAKVASVLLVIGAATSGAGLLGQEPGDKPGEAPRVEGNPRTAQAADNSVLEAKPGKFRITIDERGSVEPAKVQDVLCEVDGGTVINSIKPDGSAVKKGEVVAELDSSKLRDSLTNQRIAVQQAEASYKQAKLVREVAQSALKEYVEGYFPREAKLLNGKLALTNARVRKGASRLERAGRARKRLDEIAAASKAPETPSDVAAGLAVDDRIDEAELDLMKSKLDLEIAKSDLEIFELQTRDARSRGLMAEIDKAKQDEAAKQSRWTLEQSREKKLERQIERCTLRATVDGMILYANDPGGVGRSRIWIEEGATVRESQRFLSVFDPSGPFRINAKTREAWVDQLKPGQPVKIRIDAASNGVLSGKVTSIAPMADAAIRPNQDIKVYTTFIAVEGDTSRLNLRPGMTAEAEILLDERDDVIQVPVSCLSYSTEKGRVAVRGPDGKIERLTEDRFFVAVKLPGGKVEWRKVTTGRGNDRMVEIKDGLQPGEFVVADPSAEMGLEMSGKRRQEMPAPSPGDARQ